MFGFPLFEFILLVLGFGFLIFVHELGHFAVAKWVGIRCPQFAIGFGKAMLSYRKGIGFRSGSTEAEYEKLALEHLAKNKGEKEVATQEDGGTPYEQHEVLAAGDALGLSETEYRLNYLPLGGYVKMLGQEDMDPNAQSKDPNAYNNKPIWARACVISAGVVMNMIFGAIFLAIAFMIGVEFPSATVGTVVPGMPAATTYAEGHEGDLRYLGLREGDVILEVKGKVPEDFKYVQIAGALSSSKSAVELVVQRRGFDEPLTFRPTPERQKSGEKLLSIGFQPGPGLDLAYDKDGEGPIVAWFDERLDAVAPELRGPGKAIRISAVSGEAIDTYAQYLLAFDNSGGDPVSVTFVDQAAPDESLTVDLAPRPELVRYGDLPANLLGMVPAGRVTVVSEGSPAEAAGMKAGDLLVKVGDSERFNSLIGLSMTIADNPDTGFAFSVVRDGKLIKLGEIEPNEDGIFGIRVVPAYDTPVIARVLDTLPAAALDTPSAFMPGTTIRQINGQTIDNWSQLQQVLIALAQPDQRPASITLTYRVPVANAAPEQVTLNLTSADYDELLAAEWSPDHTNYFPMTDFTMIKADGIGDALMIGLDKSREFVLQTYITLLRLIQGDVKIYNLRGPVGIVSTGTQVAQQGIPYLLFFLGLISINLAVINFLPIPIVDGGHMVFLAWEKISGSPPSVKVQAAALYAGLAIIGFVFVATFYFDVMREISRFF